MEKEKEQCSACGSDLFFGLREKGNKLVSFPICANGDCKKAFDLFKLKKMEKGYREKLTIHRLK